MSDTPYWWTSVHEAKQAKTCARSCNAAGICLVLPGCQDQHRIDATLKKPTSFGGPFSKLFAPKGRRGWYEIDELQEAKKQRDELLNASLRLAERGWFQPNSCADMETQHDMYAMRNAIVKAVESR